LDVAGGDGKMPARLWNLLDGDVETVLREDAGLLSEREWRKARPAGGPDGDLGPLRERGRARKSGNERSRDNPDRCHVLLHPRRFIPHVFA